MLSPPDLQRPLVVRFGALGEMVLLTVLIRILAQRYGQPVDIVASGGWTRPLLAGQPGVGEIRVIRSRRMPYWLSFEQQRLVAALAARRPGPTWYCDPDDKGRWLLRKAGIPDACIVEARHSPIDSREHFVDYWARIAALTPVAYPLPAPAPAAGISGRVLPHLEVPPAAALELDAWLRARGIPPGELLLIQAGNKRTMRRGRRARATNTKFWPSERWAAVLRALRADHPEASILLLGVAAESSLNREIAALADLPRVFDVAGDLPVGRLLALEARAAGMISVDTGPSHTAAAVGGRVVVLYGEASPVNYAPSGAGASVRCLTGLRAGKLSMLGIQARDVIEAWRSLRPLAGPSGEAGP
jgi:heptosyltransferase-2/heptosyltransferase-3